MPQNCFFTNRPQNRDIGLLKNAFCVKFCCASFDFCSKQKHTSGPDFASGRHIRAGHHIRTGPDIPSGHIWGMYGHIFILCVPYGPIWPYMGLYGTKFRQPQPCSDTIDRKDHQRCTMRIYDAGSAALTSRTPPPSMSFLWSPATPSPKTVRTHIPLPPLPPPPSHVISPSSDAACHRLSSRTDK